jgi:hypothetical protein
VTNVPAPNIANHITPQIITIDRFNGEIAFRPSYAKSIPTHKISSLKSYADFADSTIKYFSGTAHYTIQFDNRAALAKEILCF